MNITLSLTPYESEMLFNVINHYQSLIDSNVVEPEHEDYYDDLMYVQMSIEEQWKEEM